MARRVDVGSAMRVSYEVDITGIRRTKRELDKLPAAIQRMRQTFNSIGEDGVARRRGMTNVMNPRASAFRTVVDEVVGRVQGRTRTAMAEAMKYGAERQERELNAAQTATGFARMSGARKSRPHSGRVDGPTAGRNETGTMIDNITWNVEEQRTADATRVVGWHGWVSVADYFVFQEKGTAGIRAANSLGRSIVPTTERLKKNLKGVARR